MAVSALADIDIDLREASIDAPQTTLTVFAICGNADVHVPEGVNVDVSGLTVLVITATGAMTPPRRTPRRSASG